MGETFKEVWKIEKQACLEADSPKPKVLVLFLTSSVTSLSLSILTCVWKYLFSWLLGSQLGNCKPVPGTMPLKNSIPFSSVVLIKIYLNLP